MKNNDKIIAFTDSTAVLGQIQSKDPELKLKKFFSSRVMKIQKALEPSKIFYINTLDNPADKLTRISTPRALFNSSNWFHGPIKMHDLNYHPAPQTFDCTEDLKKEKVQTLMALGKDENRIVNLIERSSSFEKTRRVVAYLLRWKNKLKGTITAVEIDKAELAIVHAAQQQEFAQEISKLQKGKHVSSGAIASFAPFYDQKVLRVGGKLKEQIPVMKLNII